MSRCIWIINQYASTPDTGMGGRHFYFARELAKQGYKVYLVASASHHLLREKPELDAAFKVEEIDGFNMVWVNMPSYKEAHSKQRAINWLLFPWRIRKLAKQLPDKPDTILCSSPSPLSFLGAQSLAKTFSARLVFEVRDIWPLTLTEIGGFSKKHPFIRLMQWVEDKAYRESDAVVSNLRNAVEHMVSRGMDRSKFNWIPNGVSLDEVNQEVPLNQEAVKALPVDTFTVGYTGTLGVANAIDTLIESAEILKDHSDIAFVLVGGGKEKSELQQSVKEKGLKNVVFIDPIPKVEIQSMLAKFDACYIGWLNDPLYRFGIGANKIPEYLYSGKPIIHGFSGNCDPIASSGSGVTIPASNPQLLAESILKLKALAVDERALMGRRGYKLAVSEYEYGLLAEKMSKLLFK